MRSVKNIAHIPLQKLSRYFLGHIIGTVFVIALGKFHTPNYQTVRWFIIQHLRWCYNRPDVDYNIIADEIIMLLYQQRVIESYKHKRPRVGRLTRRTTTGHNNTMTDNLNHGPKFAQIRHTLKAELMIIFYIGFVSESRCVTLDQL